MDYATAFSDPAAAVTSGTFLCANRSCRYLNKTVTEDNHTYQCSRCATYQYRGGNTMYLGKDAFTEEIEQNAADDFV